MIIFRKNTLIYNYITKKQAYWFLVLFLIQVSSVLSVKALWDPIGNKQEAVIVKVVCTHACVMNHGANVILVQEYIESKT